MGTKVDFEKCLKKNGLRISTDAVRLVKKEIELGTNDLQEAKGGLDRGAFRWSTIQSYYAMFHFARALIYQKGYFSEIGTRKLVKAAQEFLELAKRILGEK